MKRIKYLLVAATAIAALMATVGAGAASATPTTLCKVPETMGGIPICKEENQYPAGQAIHAVLEANKKVTLETPLGLVECAQSTFFGNTEGKTAMPLGEAIAVFYVGGCGEYVVTAVFGTLDLEIIDLPEWTHNGTLTFTNTQLRVKKGAKECVYEVGHAGVLTGGAMATIDLKGTLVRLGGVECPEGNGSWKAPYTVLQPEPLWIGI